MIQKMRRKKNNKQTNPPLNITQKFHKCSPNEVSTHHFSLFFHYLFALTHFPTKSRSSTGPTPRSSCPNTLWHSFQPPFSSSLLRTARIAVPFSLVALTVVVLPAWGSKSCLAGAQSRVRLWQSSDRSPKIPMGRRVFSTHVLDTHLKSHTRVLNRLSPRRGHSRVLFELRRELHMEECKRCSI